MNYTRYAGTILAGNTIQELNHLVKHKYIVLSLLGVVNPPR